SRSSCFEVIYSFLSTLMASQKGSFTVLYQLARNSTYYRYSLVPEKPLRFVYEPFYEFIRI
ncbi:MAG: hypothetical protein KJO26_08865, partial [Deltaproteobacteria bacterium]|nr:hypothetical protein [Deltaproteobacteria bacterium]